MSNHFRAASDNRWAQRRSVTIRARSIGPDIQIEAYSELDAAQMFCKLVGLAIVSANWVEDPELHVEFTIGTGNRFYAFATPES